MTCSVAVAPLHQHPVKDSNGCAGPGDAVLCDQLRAAFPFEPYDIQLGFMRNLYSCLNDGRVGLFESPTGTGKTLSIITATLLWLQHERARRAAEAEARPPPAGADDDEEPDWMRSFEHSSPERAPCDPKANAVCDPAPSHAPPATQVIYAARTHSQLSQFVGELGKVNAAKGVRVVALASRKLLCINPNVTSLRAGWRINHRCVELASSSKKQALPDGKSQASGGCPFRCKDNEAADAFVGAIAAGPMDIEELAAQGRRRAVCPYYASRTAAASADVVLVPYSCLIHRETRESLGLSLEGRIVIVDEAHNLTAAINGAHSVTLTATHLLSAARLVAFYLNKYQVRLGARKAACVTSFKALAERLHSHLLASTSQPQRPDAPEPRARQPSAPSCVLSVNAFLDAAKLSNVNVPDLLERLSEDNLLFKMAGLADELAQAAREDEGGPGALRAACCVDRPARGHTPQDAPACRTSCSKSAAAGGVDTEQGRCHTAGADAAGGGGAWDKASASAGLQLFVGFLRALTAADCKGRIVVKPAEPPELKYVLLDACSQFGDVVKQCRALVLASGTLSPLPLLTQQLFRRADLPRVRTFQCGHVVSRERVLAVALGVGPSRTTVRLTHGERDRAAVMDECGQALVQLAAVVPQGLVVFVTSFTYAAQLRSRWEATGLLRKLQLRKRIFWEAQSAAECDLLLKEYSAHIASGPAAGAALICVVGAKLSEGINFGDGLGRCVVVLGLPYPDLRDPELQERLRYVEGLDKDGAAASNSGAAGAATRGGGRPGGGGGGGGIQLGGVAREMYTNMCMQAVNQCVGRVIRHQRDYAAIVLLDVRYSAQDAGGAGVKAKVPQWLTQNWLECGCAFQPAVAALTDHFKLCASLPA